MRQIILDTETTGLEHRQGHRLIEIGCVELNNRRLTQRHFHEYLNPDFAVDAGALEVHGISNEFLADKPRFAEVVDEFLSFVAGAELVIHNAAFDVGFINNELQLLGSQYGCLEDHCAGIVDTLDLARKLHPGQRNSLDALCKRYDIDNSQRSLHGALLDAEILADVYLRMTGGQTDLLLPEADTQDVAPGVQLNNSASGSKPLRVVRASTEDLALHESWLAEIDKASDGHCVWLARSKTD